VQQRIVGTEDKTSVLSSVPTIRCRTEPYGFTDGVWTSDLDHRKSTGAYLFLLDGASSIWKVKLSPTVCLSTQQPEYYARSVGTKEALNLRLLLLDLGFGQSQRR
jgi:hypothetical protein